MQKRVLRGEILQVPVSQLSPEAKSYINSELELAHSPELASKFATFAVMRGSDVSPTLYMDFGAGGHGYVGGTPLDNQLCDEIASAWMLTGDTTIDPQDSRALVADKDAADKPHETPPAETFGVIVNGVATGNGANRAEGRLQQLADAVPLSLLAILPDDADDFGSPQGMTVGAYRQKLRAGRKHIMSKWHDDVLAINYPAWFLQAGDIAPYSVIRQLRQISKTGDVSLTALAEAAEGLSSAQLKQLRTEFVFAKLIYDMRAPLGLLRLYPEIGRKGGASITDEMRAVVQRNYLSLNNAVSRATRIQMYKTLEGTGSTVHRMVHFDIIGEHNLPVHSQKSPLTAP